MRGVLLTSVFERQAKAAGLDDDEIQEIAVAIASDPRGGELMVGTGGARKMRHAGRGEGQSGATARSIISAATTCRSSCSR